MAGPGIEPGPLALESDALATALRGPAVMGYQSNYMYTPTVV